MDGFGVRAIRAEEREECLRLWSTVWPGANSPAYFRRYFYGDREWLPYYTQVGVLDGKIVSAVQICKRTVACGDAKLTMGGIANVATLPEYRGRGYNTQCLQSAIAVMEADAMDFSLLFTGIHDYYARQGFETISQALLSGVIRADFALPKTKYAVRKAAEDDLPAIQKCYDDYNQQRPIAVQRYPAYWRDWMNIAPQHIPETLLVAVEQTGGVVGYVNTGVFKSAVPYSAEEVGASIIEFGTRGGLDVGEQDEVACALLGTVARETLAGGGTQLRLQIALTASVRQAFENIVSAAEQVIRTSGMARLLHRDNLLRSLTMGLNDRWINAGQPPGTAIFATPYGAVRLDATSAFLRVSAVETTNVGEEALPQSALFGLLFGAITPEQVTAQPESRTLLSVLFPPQAFVYYGADGF